MVSRKHKVEPFGKKILKGPAGSVLSNLFRTIMFNLGMDQDRYDALMQRYIQRALISGGRKDRADARAGLSEELLKNTMTWKTFLKGLKFLGVHKADFSICLWCDKKEPVTFMHHFNIEELNVEVDDEAQAVDGITSPGSLLAAFYATLKEGLVVTQEIHDALMQDYIRRSHVGVSKKSEAIVKAGLIKELSRSAITWKTFMKGLNFLDVRKFQLEIVLHHANFRSTTHHLEPVVLGELDNEGE